jgi:hypothetical protein
MLLSSDQGVLGPLCEPGPWQNAASGGGGLSNGGRGLGVTPFAMPSHEVGWLDASGAARETGPTISERRASSALLLDPLWGLLWGR